MMTDMSGALLRFSLVDSEAVMRQQLSKNRRRATRPWISSASGGLDGPNRTHAAWTRKACRAIEQRANALSIPPPRGQEKFPCGGMLALEEVGVSRLPVDRRHPRPDGFRADHIPRLRICGHELGRDLGSVHQCAREIAA